MTDVTDPNLSYDDYVKMRGSDQIENIHKALVVDVPVKTIPENVFINEILPVLTGEAINTDLPVLIAAVAGNPFLELDVIDHTGKILFRMPSLFERNIINQDAASRRGSMQSMLITMGQISFQSPLRAANYAAHEFSGRGIGTNSVALTNDRNARWSAIFTKYGKTLQGVKPGAIGNTSKPDSVLEIDLNDGDLF